MSEPREPKYEATAKDYAQSMLDICSGFEHNGGPKLVLVQEFKKLSEKLKELIFTFRQVLLDKKPDIQPFFLVGAQFGIMVASEHHKGVFSDENIEEAMFAMMRQTNDASLRVINRAETFEYSQKGVELIRQTPDIEKDYFAYIYDELEMHDSTVKNGFIMGFGLLFQACEDAARKAGSQAGLSELRQAVASMDYTKTDWSRELEDLLKETSGEQE